MLTAHLPHPCPLTRVIILCLTAATPQISHLVDDTGRITLIHATIPLCRSQEARDLVNTILQSMEHDINMQLRNADLRFIKHMLNACANSGKSSKGFNLPLLWAQVWGHVLAGE